MAHCGHSSDYVSECLIHLGRPLIDFFSFLSPLTGKVVFRGDVHVVYVCARQKKKKNWLSNKHSSVFKWRHCRVRVLFPPWRPAVGVETWLLSASKVLQWWSEGGGGNAAEALQLAHCVVELDYYYYVFKKKTLSKMPTVEVKIKTLTLQKCDLPQLRRLDS